jgi:hypothetical protein
LNAAPHTEGERREQFEIKRSTVNNLVEPVLIQKDRQLMITFRLDLLALAQHYDSVDRVPRVGTYIDRRDITNFDIAIVCQAQPMISLSWDLGKPKRGTARLQ